MQTPIADLHCHPSLKPNGNSEINTIWNDSNNKKPFQLFKSISWRKWLVGGILKTMATYSQSNLDKCHIGMNKLLFCTIYPIERPFLKPDRPFKNSKWFHRQILKSIFGKKLKRKVDTKIIQALTGIDENRIKAYLESVYNSDTIDYYQDYVNEHSYLLKSHNSSSTNPIFVQQPKFKLVKNYDDIIQNINNNTICGIITIEGMHAIAKYKKSDLFNKESIDDLDPVNQQDLKKVFEKNILKIKNSGNGNGEDNYPPFFITFSHHFNNLIAGHAKSFSDATFIKPGFSDVFNQRIGIDKGLSGLAKDLIVNHLFSRDNGPRILVDTKHMSLSSRDDFYKLVSQLNKNNRHDKVPIICSHTAVNGIASRNKARELPDINKYEKRAYVSKFDINLTDQDIEEIFETDGLIGICMHDGRMPGGKFKKYYKKITKMYKSKESIKRIHAQMFLTNIFHAVKVNLQYIRKNNVINPLNQITEQDAWKTISLGSDNDGIVDPFDHYNTAAKLHEFKQRIVKAIQLNDKPYMKKFRILSLPNEKPFINNELEDLMQGFTPEKVVDKIFYSNIDTFLSKYFTNKYLIGIEEHLIA